MTTVVETKKPTTTQPKKRAKPVRRGFNELGKFFAKVRIDLAITGAEWAKEVGAATITISEIERGDKPLSFDLALRIANVISAKAPHYENEFASIVVEQLGVLLVPSNITQEQLRKAYNVLHGVNVE